MKQGPERFALGATVLLCAAGAAVGQCPNLRWTGEFAAPGGLTQGSGAGFATAFQVFDPDGPGPLPAELYVGGYFTAAGAVPTRALARWNGNRWADVGGVLLPNTSGTHITAMTLHDPDGDGPLPPVLVVIGSFTSAGGIPAMNIASWDGQRWSALGTGLTDLFAQATMIDFDPDGPGPLPPVLVVASDYFTIPGVGSTSFATWDGQQWRAMAGPPGVFALAVFDDDGPGPLPPALYAGLDYIPGLERWDGASWTAVGGGLRSATHVCSALTVVDEDGPGAGRPVLWVGGQFNTAGSSPARNIARWDGQQFTAIGAGLGGQIEDIAVVDTTGGTGAPTVYAASDFASTVSRWDQAQGQWTTIGASNATYGIFTLHRLAAFDEDGPGPATPTLYYSAPGLTTISGTATSGLARYGCACYANCDGSVVPPALNVNDFVCFLNRFAAGEPYANCDGSTVPPVLNVNDFTCYLNRFAAGCP